MTALVPLPVVYAGLVGCVIALLVATAQNKWSPRVFLILALRLAIGWHFMFEGLHKIHSHLVGPTDSNKVFTSEPYFAMADGPLGPIMRKQIGDPATLISQRLVAAKDETKAKGIDEKNTKAWLEFVPDTISKEWNEYVKKFEMVYQKGQPIEAGLSDSILANYGKWLTGVEPGKESKMRYLQTDVPYTVPQRLKHLEKVEKQLAELMDRQKAGFGQGYGYDQTRITAAKAELRTVRTDLLADSDAMMAAMKKALLTPTTYLLSEAKINELLSHNVPKENPTFETAVPAWLKTMWDNYHELAQSKLPANEKIVFTDQSNNPKKLLDDTTNASKKTLTEWFAKNWAKLVAETKLPDADKASKAKADILSQLDKSFAGYQESIQQVYPAVTSDSVLAEKKAKPIEEMDKFTMWFIAGVGACIFFGLFTPIACLAACGFLVLTYLTHPPFPWLPMPPNTEGNPLFVNKNVIEAIALLVIAAHPTGRWMGLDALWTYCCGISKRQPN